MALTTETLEAILQKGDEKACVALFAEATEEERQAVAAFVIRWLKEKEDTHAARVAALASCSLSQLKKLGWRALVPDETAVAIMSDRRPAWLRDWAKAILDEHPRAWPIVRRLERAGLCQRPETDNYWLGMLDHHGVLGCSTSVRTGLLADPALLDEVWRFFEIEGSGEFSLATRDKYSRPEGKWETALVQLADEGKLERARLLDASLNTLARDFAQFRASWFSRFHEALHPTVAERAERADRYLPLLASKIPPTVSFALNSLKVLDKAGKLPADAVLAHIGPALFARQKGTVLEALKLLDRAAQLEPALKARVTHCATEAIRHEAAQVQGAVLDLIEKHGTPTDARLVQLLGQHVSELAASQRPRLLTWLATSNEKPAPEGSKVQPADTKALLLRAWKLDRQIAKLAGVDDVLAALEDDRSNIRVIDLDPMAIPRLDPDKRVKPIEDLDELIDVFAHVLEEPDDPMEVERVLDGVARLCDQRPADFVVRSGPLRKRATDRLAKLFAGPFIGCGVLADLCGVARAWLGGEVILPVAGKTDRYDKTIRDYQYDNSKDVVEFFVYHLPTARKFLSHRTLALAQRCAIGDAAALLAAPTHAGGWIDPRELVQRSILLDSLKKEADSIDQIQALLRLAPEHRSAALKSARKIRGEFGAALRYALGSDEKIGDNPSLWVASARARSPVTNDDRLERKHPGLGPDGGQAARYQADLKKHPRVNSQLLRITVEPPLPSQLEPEMVTVMMNRMQDEYDHMEITEAPADLRWMLSIWPMQRESWFARMLPRFGDNLDWWEARWNHRTFLEPLLDPDVPLKPMAIMMLALGLAAKEPGESGLATDALIAAIDDGRLDASKLGETLAFLAPMTKCARLARTLGQAARISPLHLQAVVQVIQNSLRGNSGNVPRDLQALLDLLKESLTELSEVITDAEARCYLERIETSGKTARLIRELLALEVKPAPLIRRQALLRALEHRVGRAESWSRRVE